MRIAVCDDELIFRNELITLLREYDSPIIETFIIDEYDNGISLINSNTNYDVVFLDYQMRGLNGIATAERIRTVDPHTKIIFVSSYSDIVFDCLKYNIFRFLVKPIDPNKLYEALEGLETELNSKYKIIVKDINTDENITVAEKDIIYAQADNVYTLIVTDDQTLRFPYTISKLEAKLQSTYFMRVHRSYIVNFKYITSFNKTSITLSNGQKSSLSRSKYNEFCSQYLNFIKDSRGI